MKQETMDEARNNGSWISLFTAESVCEAAEASIPFENDVNSKKNHSFTAESICESAEPSIPFENDGRMICGKWFEESGLKKK